MRAGPLRHQVYLGKPVTTQNSTGEEVTSFVESGWVYGSAEPLRGREAALLSSSAVVAQWDTKICVRYGVLTEALSPKWRLRIGTTYYDIVSVTNVKMRNRELEIMCKSGASFG